MNPAVGQFFRLSATSWLAQHLEKVPGSVYALKDALGCECRPNKHEEIRPEIRESVDAELGLIRSLPEGGRAIRCDRMESARASEFGGSRNPSVDICSSDGTELLLVECKYKAMPETSIVKSIPDFDYNVARKFAATVSFLKHEGATSICPQKVVLFNAGSKDKVLNMFNRLKLEIDDADNDLNSYVIMDTMEFYESYMSRFVA